MELKKRIKRICHGIRMMFIGKRLKKRIFLEKVLADANRKWFGYSEDVFKGLCKDLSIQVRGDYNKAFDNFELEYFEHFQRIAHRRSNKDERLKYIPIHILSITALSSSLYHVEFIRKHDEEKEVVYRHDVSISFREIEEEVWGSVVG